MSTVAASTTDVTDITRTVAAAGKRAARRRVAAVWAGRIALAAVILGGWQLCTSVGIVDKFFFGQPTGIATSLVNYFKNGTEFGSYYYNIWVTVEEALIGFLAGTAAGVLL